MEREKEAMEDLPPGFRFYPTEEELVSFYLHNKLEGRRRDLSQVMNRIIPVVDIYEFNPWDLPQYAGELCRRDPEQWFFFIPIQEREARGGRPNRLTDSGYWKATGCPGCVYSSGNGVNGSRVIGVKRTMVFYEGRAPAGRKTEWKMNEYKAIEGEAASSSSAPPKLRHEFSLCRVYKKSKCLRAFDRRPSGVAAGEAAVQQAHGADEATTSHQNVPTGERTSSPDSSPSGGGCAHPSDHTGESGNWEMAVDNESPLWDWDQWEQMNWF